MMGGGALFAPLCHYLLGGVQLFDEGGGGEGGKGGGGGSVRCGAGKRSQE